MFDFHGNCVWTYRPENMNNIDRVHIFSSHFLRFLVLWRNLQMNDNLLFLAQSVCEWNWANQRCKQNKSRQYQVLFYDKELSSPSNDLICFRRRCCCCHNCCHFQSLTFFSISRFFFRSKEMRCVAIYFVSRTKCVSLFFRLTHSRLPIWCTSF